MNTRTRTRKIKNFAKEKGEVGTTFEKGSPKIAVAKNVGKKGEP